MPCSVFRGLPLSFVSILLLASSVAAQSTDLRPVEFAITGTVTDASDDAPIERARIIVTDDATGLVLLERAFTDIAGDYVAVFENEVEVTVGIDDPDDPQETASDGLWMGAIGPNPVHGGGDVQLVLPYSARADDESAPVVELYDLRGRRLETGETLGSGIYLYRLRFDERAVDARKMIVLGPTRPRIQLVRTSGPGRIDDVPGGLSRRVDATTSVRVRIERPGFVPEESTIVVAAETGAVVDAALDAEAPPTADLLTGGSTQAGESTLFDATGSTASDGGDLFFAWDFGDGQRGTGGEVAHVYAAAGSYDVTVTVTGSHGATATASTQLTITAPETPATVDAQLVGSITDVAGNLLSGVRASLVGFAPVDSSDSDGAVTLENVPTGVPLSIQLEKEGYAEQVVRLTLPADVDFGHFESTLARRAASVPVRKVEDGGAIRGLDGATIDLPVEALVDGNGTPVTGDVTLSLTPLDVADARQSLAFPGGYEGLTPTGTRGLILSYGTMEIEFEQNGEALQLAPGRAATVEIPLYATNASAGETIALWSMDPSTGLWREEGSGTVVSSPNSPTGRALRAEVSHFSWWNADKFEDEPYRVIPECKINDENGLPTLEIPPGESCYINGRTVGGGGPFGNPNTNVRPGTPQVLAIPSRTSFALNASTSGGTVAGSVVVNGEPGDEDTIVIGLDPVDSGGGALSFPSDLTASIDPADETDTYTMELAAGQRFALSVVANAPSTVQGEVRVFDPSTGLFDSTTFGPNAPGVIFREVPATGTYTIEVEGTNAQVGAYDLRIELVEIQTLTVDVPVTFDTDPGSIDSFVFSATEGQWISLGQRRLEGFSGGSGRLTLQRPDGSVAREWNFGFSGYDLGLFEIDTTGDWTATVRMTDLDGRLYLLVGAVPEIALDQSLEGVLESRGTRYYRTTAGVGTPIRAGLLRGTGFSGNVSIVRSDFGGLDVGIDVQDGFQDATAVTVSTQEGPVFVRVGATFNTNDRTTRDYRVILHRVRDPGQPIFDAAGRARFTETIDRFARIDLHTIDLEAGDGLVVTLRDDGSNGPGVNAVAQLRRIGSGTTFVPDFDFSLVSVARSSGDAANGVLEQEVFTVGTSGTHVLALAALDGATGSFEVTIDRVPSLSTIVVDDDLSQCASATTRSLLGAMAAVPDGGTIELCEGEWSGILTYLTRATDVTLQGAGQGLSVVSLLERGAVLFFDGNATAVRDLEIRTTRGQSSDGIYVADPAGTVIERVTIGPAPGTDPVDRGIEMGSGQDVRVSDVTFDRNRRAVYATFADDVVVEDCTMDGWWGMVEVRGADRAIVRRNTFTSDALGQVLKLIDGAAHQVFDNVVIIATGDIGANLNTQAFSVFDRDDDDDKPATIVRDNRITTNEAGLELTVEVEGSELVCENNVVVCTDPIGRQALKLGTSRQEPNQTLVVRNNTFDGVRLFDTVTMFGAEFVETDVMNNSFRIAPGTNLQPTYVFLEIRPIGSNIGAVPFRFVNNVVDGVGGGIAVETLNGATIITDYNVFGSFETYFAGAQTTGGANDLTGVDPQFADGELRLAPTSPGVDSGATTAQFGAIPTDAIDGTVRPQGAGVDRGAWEQ